MRHLFVGLASVKPTRQPFAQSELVQVDLTAHGTSRLSELTTSGATVATVLRLECDNVSTRQNRG